MTRTPMKTIEELANIGAAAAALKNSETFLIGISPESQFWKGDQPAREAFARAVRDAVLADQPAADVPTWRPIAEFPARPHDDDGNPNEYVYWDGDTTWPGGYTRKLDATHFIAPPPKPDPFEAWWIAHGLAIGGKEAARQAWNAAREVKP